MKLHSFGRLFSVVAVLALVFALTFAVTANAQETEPQTTEEIEIVAPYLDVCGNIRLEWDKVTGAAEYVVIINGEHVATTLACYYNVNGLTVDPHGADERTYYDFKVIAYDRNGVKLDTYTREGFTAEHAYDNGVVTDPTCTEEGYTTFTCACGDSYKDNYTDLVPHVYEYECSTECSNCDEGTREADHRYTTDCDETCEYCYELRETTVDHTYTLPCDAWCAVCYENTRPEAAHTLIHVDAKASTCVEYGNIEYWYCEHCLTKWDNENAVGIPLFRGMEIIMEYSDHKFTADCDTTCENCDETRVAETDHTYTLACDAWCAVCYENTRPEATHTLSGHVEAKAPTCDADGNIEYWYCEHCGIKFDNPEGTGMALFRGAEIDFNRPDHRFTADCDTTCENCDETRVAETDHTYTLPCDAWCAVCYENTRPEATHTLSGHVEAKAPTCDADGNIEYWYCEHCGIKFDNPDGTGMALFRGAEIDFNRPDHQFTADCDTTCENCDETRVAVTSHTYNRACDAWCAVCYEETRPEATHTLSGHVEAKAPTCDADGNIEYWYCEHCGIKFDNPEGTGMALFRGAEIDFNRPAHEYFYVCDAHCMNCGELTNPEAAHTIVHVDYKAPTCNADGNVEYWYCEHCGSCWLDDACTMLTNRMSIVLWDRPAHEYNYDCDKNCKICGEETRPEADHRYFADCDVTCEDCSLENRTTNVAHEYFYACDAYCMNCGELTNPEAAHTIVHVEYKDPTCNADGNVEYWYCEHCGSCWLDEACTMLTNRMSIVLWDRPAHEYNYDCDKNCKNCGEETRPEADHDYGEATCTEAGTCEFCGASTGDALGHDYQNYVYNGDATCTEDGTETGTCTRCGGVDTRDMTGSALGHEYVNYVSNGDATCTKNETATAKCTRCDSTDTKELEDTKLPHTFTEPDCESDGKCTECGATGEKALGHNYVQYIDNDDATCTKNETSTAKCTRCDSIDTKNLEGTMLPHTFTEPDCENDGKCTVCGATGEKALGHAFMANADPENVIIYKVCATCGEQGKPAGTIINFHNKTVQKVCVVAASALIIILCIRALISPATTTPWYKRRRYK